MCPHGVPEGVLFLRGTRRPVSGSNCAATGSAAYYLYLDFKHLLADKLLGTKLSVKAPQLIGLYFV